MHRIRNLVLLLLILLAFAAPLQAQEAPPAPEVTLEKAWSGYVRSNGWSEIYVTLSNENDDWEGTLEIVDNGTKARYRYDVSLPAHSRKEYRIPVFVDATPRLELQLQTGRDVVYVEKVNFNSRSSSTRVCTVVDPQGVAAEEGGLPRCLVNVWLADVSKFPETPMAWDTINLLLLNGVSTAELSAEQREALLSWVGMGGHLVVAGGPALAQTMSGLPDELQVAEVGTSRLMTPDFIAAAAPVAVAELTPGAEAWVLLESAGEALAVRAAVGQGKVDVLGWDLAADSKRDWMGALWEDDPVNFMNAFVDSGSRLPDVDIQSLMQVPPLIHLWFWIPLFPLYILVMGPGTLFIVRRLKRPLMAWVLLPLWIGAMLGLLLVIFSGITAQAFPLTHDIALVFVPGGGLPARSFQATAIYAPRLTRVNWTSIAAQRPYQGSYEMEYFYGEGEDYPAVVSQIGEETYGVQAEKNVGVLTWAAEGLVTAPEFSADLTLSHPNRKDVEGSLSSSVPLKELFLVWPNTGHWIGLMDSLPASREVSFTSPLVQAYPTNRYGYDRSSNLTCESALLESTPSITTKTPTDQPERLRSNVCYLVGKREKYVPFPLGDIGGTQVQETCFVYAVSCPSQSRGSIEMNLEANPSLVENGWLQGDGNVLHVQPPNTTILYEKPGYLSIERVKNLTISLQKGAGMDNPTVEEVNLWDWDEEAWVEQSISAIPGEINLSGAEARRFFDPERGLKIRLTPANNSHMPVEITVQVEGSW